MRSLHTGFCGSSSSMLLRVSIAFVVLAEAASRGDKPNGADPKPLWRVFSNWKAFLVINDAGGTGQCWGTLTSGGNCTSVDFHGVTNVFSTSAAFAAINPSAGTGQCWGDPKKGGSCEYTPDSQKPIDFRGVTQIYSTTQAFAVIKYKRAQTRGGWINSNRPHSIRTI